MENRSLDVYVLHRGINVYVLCIRSYVYHLVCMYYIMVQPYSLLCVFAFEINGE
jgi:hypothetical protein